MSRRASRQLFTFWLAVGIVLQQSPGADANVSQVALQVGSMMVVDAAGSAKEDNGVGADDPQDAFSPEAVLRNAEAGVPTAQYSIAQQFHYGHGAKRDLAQARQWYERAAVQGHSWSQRVLGTMLAAGEGGPADVSAAVQWLRKAAEQGEPYAMSELGVLLRRSPVPHRDLAEASRWLLAAAQRDDARAQFQLALMLETGEGIAQDTKQAELWLRRASAKEDAARLHLQDTANHQSPSAPADNALRLARASEQATRGDVAATFALGRMLLDGVGRFPDEEAAAHWLRKAATAGHPGAMFYLYLYLSRHEAETTAEMKTWVKKAAEGGYAAAQTSWARHQQFGSKEMVRWLQKAAEQGDLNAQHHLGSLPFEVSCGVSKADGVKWLKKAAEKGHTDAQYMLGTIMQEGWAGKADAKPALEWYRMAADQGHASSMAAIGRMYEDGRTDQDAQTAFEWLLKAEQMGALNLTDHIAEMYAEGAGTPQNPALALKWYIKSARQSPENYAWNNARRVRALLNDHPEAPFDYEELVGFLTAAAGWGYPDAQFELGMLYRTGRGVRKDPAEAAMWIEKAAKRGHRESIEALAQMLSVGEGIRADDAEALRLLQKGAQEGDSRAQLALSRRYQEGQGLPTDPGLALDWLTKAAESGLPEARFQLGLRMVQGDGLPADVKQGVDLINQAAETLPEARVYLMDWLQAYPEPERAVVPFKTLLAAAENGDPAAQFELGERYRAVQTYAVDVEASIRWLQRAAEQDYPPAQLRLAKTLREHLWLRGGREKPPEPEKAMRWMRRAAELGFAPAQFELAQQLLHGFGVKRDSRQAIDWLQHASKQGHAEASNLLGELFGHGGYRQDVELPAFDREAAQKWYLQAVSQGHPMAYLGVARLYDRPPAGERDAAEAMRWYQRALNAGVRVAAWTLAEAYLHGDGVSADPARAVSLLEQLFEQGDENGAGRHAMERLGEIFEQGDGVRQDIRKALAYYERAAEYSFSDPAFRAAALYHAGPDDIRNPAEALRWYLIAINYWIEGGDGTEVFNGPIAKPYGNLANARFALALRLERGDGLTKDVGEALRWYRAAAYFERKYPETAALAAFKVASLLEREPHHAVQVHEGKQQEREQPIDWYKKAAATIERLQPAPLVFSDRWSDQDEVVTDLDRRLPGLIADLRQLSQKGIPEAQYDLARFYLLGRGVPRNEAEATTLLKKAAEKGYLAALCKLGDMSSGEPEQAAETHARAREYFHQAAEHLFKRMPIGPHFEGALRVANPHPEYAAVEKSLRALVRRKPSPTERPNITVFVMEGESSGASTSLKELKELAKRRGVPDAWADVALHALPLMEKAKGATNPQQAVQWMRKAAESGFPEAQSALAEFYEAGRGVKQDWVVAYTWFCLAAAQGDSEGQDGMHRLREKLGKKGIAEAERQAFAWWQRHQAKPPKTR
jgi:TPR repeat protein